MYRVYKEVLDHEFCDYIANIFKERFEYDPRGDWNAYTLREKALYDEIIAKFSPVVPYNFKANWINITEYETGRGLRNHTDSNSSLTIVSELTDGYEGGRFIVNKDTYIKLNKGDVITFKGEEVYHGVEKVSKGVRLSLNLWTAPDTEHLI